MIKLYEPGPIQCLDVAPVDHMVGRVPLIPLFLAGNSTTTIPHKFSKHKGHGSGFPMGYADLAASDGRRGSSVYEVNTWLWNFGNGKPRLGGLTVEETVTAMRKETVRNDQLEANLASVLLRLVGARGWTEHDPIMMKCAVWLTSVPVRTSVPVSESES